MPKASDILEMIPCYLPSQVFAGDEVLDVHLTRIGRERALLSGELPMRVGDHAEIELDRPTDGCRVRAGFRVTRVKRDGAQWGWKPSFHLAFDDPLEALTPLGGEVDDVGDAEAAEEADDEADDDAPLSPPLPFGDTQDVAPLDDGAATGADACADADADADAEEDSLTRYVESEADTQPAAPVLRDPEAPPDAVEAWEATTRGKHADTIETLRAMKAVLSGDTLETPSHLLTGQLPGPEGVGDGSGDGEDGDGEDDDGDAPGDHPEEETADEVLAEQLASHLARALVELKPDDTGADLDVPPLGSLDPEQSAPPQLHGPGSRDPDDPPAPPAMPAPAGAAPQEPPSPTTTDDDPYQDLTPGGTAIPPWERNADGGTLPRRPTAATPWSAPGGPQAPAQVGRPSRILSQTPAHYTWAGERRYGTVQDFGRQGLFLAVMTRAPMPPPGAVVRVEFKLELDREPRQVRLTGEVRWLHGNGDAGAAGRGMGVQIVDFEAAAMRRTYERHVASILRDAPG